MLHGPQHSSEARTPFHIDASVPNTELEQLWTIFRYSNASSLSATRISLASAQNFSAARCDCDFDEVARRLLFGPENRRHTTSARFSLAFEKCVRLNLEIEITRATASTAAFCLLEFRFFVFLFHFSIPCVSQKMYRPRSQPYNGNV